MIGIAKGAPNGLERNWTLGLRAPRVWNQESMDFVWSMYVRPSSPFPEGVDDEAVITISCQSARRVYADATHSERTNKWMKPSLLRIMHAQANGSGLPGDVGVGLAIAMYARSPQHRISRRSPPTEWLVTKICIVREMPCQSVRAIRTLIHRTISPSKKLPCATLLVHM